MVLTLLLVARWLRASWNLTRTTAAQNIARGCRLSDLDTGDDRGSEHVWLTRGLLSDSQAKVIFRQAAAGPALVRNLCCRLSERERRSWPACPRARRSGRGAAGRPWSSTCSARGRGRSRGRMSAC